jgi:hypothetical protein
MKEYSNEIPSEFFSNRQFLNNSDEDLIGKKGNAEEMVALNTDIKSSKDYINKEKLVLSFIKNEINKINFKPGFLGFFHAKNNKDIISIDGVQKHKTTATSTVYNLEKEELRKVGEIFQNPHLQRYDKLNFGAILNFSFEDKDIAKSEWYDRLKTKLGNLESSFNVLLSEESRSRTELVNYLSYELFQLSKKIPYTKRNGSSLYQSLMCRIAMLQNCENPEDFEKNNITIDKVIGQVELRMRNGIKWDSEMANEFENSNSALTSSK